MSTFTYPGVYIEELSSGQHTITGVATSIAAFIGWAPQGPVTEPVLVESWSEYQTVFGGLDSRSYLGYAINQFFANGGTQAYILRLVANSDSDPKANIATTARNTINGLSIFASSPGAWANTLSILVMQPMTANAGFGVTVSQVTSSGIKLLESYSNLSLSPISSQYAVTVINSDSSYITFIDPQNPSGAIAIPAAPATFTAAATGFPVPTVQWQVNTGGGFTDIPGATSTTYSVGAIAAQSGNQLRAVFTNSKGTATSNAVTLTVSTAPAVPVVTTAPVNQTTTVGASATFTAAASGNPTPTVQWQIVKGASAADLPGATSTTFTISNATQAQNNNIYQAVFRNGLGAPVISTPATLTIAATAVPPAITTDLPATLSVDLGGTATLTAAASGVPAPQIQWQVSTNNGASFTPIAGATSATYTIPPATAAQDQNQYQAVFSNGASPSATTKASVLTVNSTLAAPAVSTQPLDQSVSAAPPFGSITASLGSGPGSTAAVDGDILDPTDAINANYFTKTLIPTGASPASPGYLLFERVHLFNLLCVPGYSNAASTNTLLDYCNRRRAFMIVDPPLNMTLQNLLSNNQSPLAAGNSLFSGPWLSNAAYYFPWISAPDPLFGGRAKLFPPCGFVAGIYASTDANRGVWKAPAGINARGG